MASLIKFTRNWITIVFLKRLACALLAEYSESRWRLCWTVCRNNIYYVCRLLNILHCLGVIQQFSAAAHVPRRVIKLSVDEPHWRAGQIQLEYLDWNELGSLALHFDLLLFRRWFNLISLYLPAHHPYCRRRRNINTVPLTYKSRWWRC